MSIADFNISLKQVECALSFFSLLRMRGTKNINKDGVSSDFLKNSQTTNYYNIYSTGLKELDFDFLLCDQSFLQFEYKKSAENIIIRYAYFQNPINYISYDEYLIESDYELEEVGDAFRDEYEQFINEQELNNQFTPIRYDYDLMGYSPLLHSVSHIHIGHNNSVRIPLDKIISPLMFSLFIIKHTYYKEWKYCAENKQDELHQFFKNANWGISLEKAFWQSMETEELYMI